MKMGSEQPKIRIEVKLEDIRPEIPESGGTIMVLQRNARDDRSDPKDIEKFGTLIPEAAERVKEQARDFFDKILKRLNEGERGKVRVLVVASDASLIMPTGDKSPHMRAVETANKVIEGVKDSFDGNSVDRDQLLNESASSEKGPVKMSGLVDLRMFEQSPEFVAYMTEKYGPNKDFWIAYEEDAEHEKRIELGVEGPSEIADRVRTALAALLQSIAKEYHDKNPDTLLYVWAVSHYDSISPFIKECVYKKDPAKTYVPVESGAGITIKIDRENKTAETIIGERTYDVSSVLG